ncbi:MAG: TetR/AcrR family transcriptional regulator [Marmoricola sp.]
MASEKLTRPKRRFDGLREDVLDAAWDLLVERGLADLTLAELGRRVDTSAGHLLYHFGSKDELLLEALRRSEGQLWDRWQAQRAQGATFQEHFRLFCAQFLPVGVGDPRWLIWVELWPRVLRVEELRPSFDAMDEVWRVELADLLSEAGVPDPAPLARRICWLLDGLAVSIVIGETSIDVPEAIEHAIALLPPELAGSF